MTEEKISYFINKAKTIDPNNFGKKIKIGIIGSYTFNGLSEVLQVKCHELKIQMTSLVGEYNQYNQEILDPKSNLYRFNSDITFLLLDVRTVLGDSYYFPHNFSKEERRKIIQEKSDEIKTLIDCFKMNSKAKLILTNFNVPTYSSYGIFENKTEYGLKEMVQELNKKIEDLVKKEQSVFVFDFDGFVRKHGEENIFNYRQYFFGDVKVSIDFMPHLGNELMGFVKPILGLNKKCIVVDLDNTLWGGIVGEDGFDGIKLGPYTQGRPFLELQKILLGLNKRGIILAINSKNNYEDAIKIIRKHPYMLIKEENFASKQINWSDKITNMQEIAKELNIGLDSIVFLDDDPINRELMRSALPEVLTIDLPRDPSEYCSCVMNLNDFNLLKITEDDLNRSKMYHDEQKRKEFAKTTPDLENFLKKMDINVIIKKADGFTIPRISQLTLKTNQFNLTTKRYQEEDIKKFTEDKNYLVGSAQVSDKFGDNGITGVFIVEKQKDEWRIDTFLLSCRVMGRGVEEGILGHILGEAKKVGINKVKGRFVPTKKNKPCEDFFKKSGFKKEGEFWSFNLENIIKMPKHLTVNEYE